MSFVSTISNKIVLEGPPKIFQHFENFVGLVGQIAALRSGDVRRQCVFSGPTLRPAEDINAWGSKAYNLAIAVVGGADVDEALFSNLKQGEILAQIFFCSHSANGASLCNAHVSFT